MLKYFYQFLIYVEIQVNKNNLQECEVRFLIFLSKLSSIALS